MSGIVIADSSPLIGLARIGQLELLHLLYTEIWIPPAVHTELKPDAQRPGSQKLKAALEANWLHVASSDQFSAETCAELLQSLDLGESEAIALAEAMNARFLLIDERKGRMVATRRGLPIAGIGSVLLAAKHHGHIQSIAVELAALKKAGYRLSDVLVRKLLELAGE
ncbi:MAG: DUF3368 domain-containing protein [Candidatus Thiothrix singaporensis]|uniref:DUF3368 domain-containing protein n=1 Tax=Candidatus Thiothrix singaporensis TaxID=2799669 RepID=A0A7L6ARF8_9GAMM|nr:MAG: DUF3368 domain-containing protein [Candidatus Thiothrix singaporensis]